MKSDVWVTRFRSLLGTAAFSWEVAIDHHDRWWIIVVACWLLGAPIEKIINFMSSGRLQIVLKDEQEKEPSTKLPPSTPSS